MTDHASLLRQIREDARPYIEQALDLAEVFTGFRKLASENGLDWGVIKALIKAEVQDEREGGDEKVKRIIDKADFASAYADMLGLGAKMNEKKITSDPRGEYVEGIGWVKDGKCEKYEGGPITAFSTALPPHDEDGVIIETASAPGAGVPDPLATCGGTSVAKDDAGEIDGGAADAAGVSDASSITSAPPIADQGPGIGSPLPLVPGPTEFPDLPTQFDRRSRAA
jgi:hypothetical protein